MRTYWYLIPELLDRTTLQQLIQEELSPVRIAKRIGCSPYSVRTAMRHHNLKRGYGKYRKRRRGDSDRL